MCPELFFHDKDFKEAEWPALQNTISDVTKALASGIEANLRERGYRQASNLSTSIALLSTPGKLGACQGLAETLRSGMEATSAEVFIYEAVSRQLRLVTVTGESSQTSTDIPPEVLEVFRNKRERILGNQNDTESTLLVPIQGRKSSESMEGVVAVRRLLRNGNGNRASHFNYDDIAVMEAVLQAFGPALATIRIDEQRRFNMQKLSHELKTPVMVFGAIMDQMRRECDLQSVRFRYPHFNEAEI